MEKIIELPDFLPYPGILPFSDVPELMGKLAYIIKEYSECVSLNVLLNEEDVCVRVGDWDGNVIDITDDSEKAKVGMELIDNYLNNLLGMMQCVKLSQALFYIARYENELCLVDLRLSLNKFSSPGMIRDLFSKVIRTQEVTKIVSLDKETMEAIVAGKGAYSGNLILKSSAFETIERETPQGNALYPLYAKIDRTPPPKAQKKRQTTYKPK